MDGAETRGRSSSKRMASARVSGTTSRSRGKGASRGGKSDTEQPVSGVRWAGVALVMAALTGAIALAVFSPSEPGDVRAGVQAGPTPTATVKPDGRVPETEVRIIDPVDGTTTLEREYVITVTVPEYDLPKNVVALQVYRNDKPSGSGLVLRPDADDIAVGPIKLVAGRNIITAALTTSSGAGPMSEPIVIDVDKAGPEIDVTAPSEDVRVFEGTIDIAGTTEVGAKVTVRNTTNGRERIQTVGPSGEFSASVALQDGRNKIVVRAVDAAGNKAKHVRRDVTRVDPVPRVKLAVRPGELSLAALPRKVRLTATALDSTDEPIEGAEVIFTISIPDQASRNETVFTDADGQARWVAEITPGGAQKGEGRVAVEVRNRGKSATKTKKLELR